MLDMNVTYRDLGLIAVFIVIIAAGIFLIKALVSLGGALRGVNKIIRENAGEIDKVVKDLPKLSENAVTLTGLAADIAENLRNEQEIIENALENVSDTIEAVSDTARTINEDLLGGIKGFINAITTVANFIMKRKAPDGAGAADAADGGVHKKGRVRAGNAQTIVKVSSGGAADSVSGGADADAGADAGAEAETDGTGSAGAARAGRREKRAAKPRKRNAAAPVRKRYADKGKNINIHIR